MFNKKESKILKKFDKRIKRVVGFIKYTILKYKQERKILLKSLKSKKKKSFSIVLKKNRLKLHKNRQKSYKQIKKNLVKITNFWLLKQILKSFFSFSKNTWFLNIKSGGYSSLQSNLIESLSFYNSKKVSNKLLFLTNFIFKSKINRKRDLSDMKLFNLVLSNNRELVQRLNTYTLYWYDTEFNFFRKKKPGYIKNFDLMNAQHSNIYYMFSKERILLKKYFHKEYKQRGVQFFFLHYNNPMLTDLDLNKLTVRAFTQNLDVMQFSTYVHTLQSSLYRNILSNFGEVKKDKLSLLNVKNFVSNQISNNKVQLINEFYYDQYDISKSKINLLRKSKFIRKKERYIDRFRNIFYHFYKPSYMVYWKYRKLLNNYKHIYFRYTLPRKKASRYTNSLLEGYKRVYYSNDSSSRRFYISRKFILYKQLFNHLYGNHNFKLFSKYYQLAMTFKMDKVNKLFDYYERLLPTVLYRMGFIIKIIDGFKLIRYGFVKVNGKIITSVNFIVKDFALIEIDSYGYSMYLLNFLKFNIYKTSKNFPRRFITMNLRHPRTIKLRPILNKNFLNNDKFTLPRKPKGRRPYYFKHVNKFPNHINRLHKYSKVYKNIPPHLIVNFRIHKGIFLRAPKVSLEEKFLKYNPAKFKTMRYPFSLYYHILRTFSYLNKKF